MCWGLIKDLQYVELSNLALFTLCVQSTIYFFLINFFAREV